MKFYSGGIRFGKGTKPKLLEKSGQNELNLVTLEQPANQSTPKMVQNRIQFAFSALGLSTNSPNTFDWYLDFKASKHMTYSPDNFVDVRKCVGALKSMSKMVNRFPLMLLVIFFILHH